jgi:hypothetical protein
MLVENSWLRKPGRSGGPHAAWRGATPACGEAIFAFMNGIEMEIIQYLKLNPEAYHNRKEICRRARSRSDFEENPHWATAPLASLVAQKYVEMNESGHYRLSPNIDRML